MCFRIPFCIHSWSGRLNFGKKGESCCTLMHTLSTFSGRELRGNPKKSACRLHRTVLYTCYTQRRKPKREVRILLWWLGGRGGGVLEGWIKWDDSGKCLDLFHYYSLYAPAPSELYEPFFTALKETSRVRISFWWTTDSSSNITGIFHLPVIKIFVAIV